LFAYHLKVIQTKLKQVRSFKQTICPTIWGPKYSEIEGLQEETLRRNLSARQFGGRSIPRLGDYKKQPYAAGENTPAARLAL